MPDDHKQRISVALMGKKLTPEHRANISKARTGRCDLTDDGRRRIAAASSARMKERWRKRRERQA
jgi:hypothetical protein